jgi:hypothetical protein
MAEIVTRALLHFRCPAASAWHVVLLWKFERCSCLLRPMQASHSSMMTSAWQRRPSQTCRSMGRCHSRRRPRSGRCSAEQPLLHRQGISPYSPDGPRNVTGTLIIRHGAACASTCGAQPAEARSHLHQAEEQFPSLGGQASSSGGAAPPVAQQLISAADASLLGPQSASSQAGRRHVESEEHALARQFFPDEFEDEGTSASTAQAPQQQQAAAPRSSAPSTRRCCGLRSYTIFAMHGVQNTAHVAPRHQAVHRCALPVADPSLSCCAVSPCHWCGSQ